MVVGPYQLQVLGHNACIHLGHPHVPLSRTAAIKLTHAAIARAGQVTLLSHCL